MQILMSSVFTSQLQKRKTKCEFLICLNGLKWDRPDFLMNAMPNHRANQCFLCALRTNRQLFLMLLFIFIISESRF